MVMIPNKDKPKVNEVRPIALTKVICRLEIPALRVNNEEHINRKGIEKYKHAGISEEGRVDNTEILHTGDMLIKETMVTSNDYYFFN